MTKGPDYTRGLIEPPQGEIKKKGYTLAVYTKEQMKRLNVDKFGKKLKEKNKNGMSPVKFNTWGIRKDFMNF